jgi:hypothetical protein
MGPPAQAHLLHRGASGGASTTGTLLALARTVPARSMPLHGMVCDGMAYACVAKGIHVSVLTQGRAVQHVVVGRPTPLPLVVPVVDA